MKGGHEIGAEAAWDRAYRKLLEEQHLPVLPRTPEAIVHGQRRMGHLLSTDPGGSWVAESNGEIAGVAQAHIRGHTWVLATLGVVADRQDGGRLRGSPEARLPPGQRPGRQPDRHGDRERRRHGGAWIGPWFRCRVPVEPWIPAPHRRGGRIRDHS